MASPQLDLLAPFGTRPEDKWFRTAYKWKIDKIFEWMKGIAAEGGVDVDPGDKDNARNLLTAIYNNLRSLSLPDGSLYKDAKKQPWSHIARLLNQNWNSEDETTSKFIVSGWPFRTSIQPFTGTVPKWWSPYDLLGLFFSLLGPAPSGANKNNFYLPLTAVYGRWCLRIAGKPDASWKWKREPKDNGAGALPFMFQCTWQIEVDEKTKQHWGQYFLGASTAGDWFHTVKTWKTYTGSWRERVQEARFDMLFKCQKMPMVQRDDFRKKTAPSQTKPGGTGVPFGNCAETYPFAIRFLADETQNAKSMTGLALQKNFMEMEEYPEYDEYSTSDIWNNLMGPCANCKHLIKNAGAKESQFGKDLDKQKAPKRPKPLLEAEKLMVEN